MSRKKSSKQAVARRYAKALFELATEKNSLEKVEEDFAGISATLEASDQLVQILKNRSLSRGAIYSIFSHILKSLQADKITEDFCRLLGEHRRLDILADIIESFKTIVSQAMGEILAEVTSAAPLNDNQKDQIKKQLKEMTGKKVDFEEIVDEEIIGGLVIRIGSQMLDNSINGKLERLRVFQKQAALPT